MNEYLTQLLGIICMNRRGKISAVEASEQVLDIKIEVGNVAFRWLVEEIIPEFQNFMQDKLHLFNTIDSKKLTDVEIRENIDYQKYKREVYAKAGIPNCDYESVVADINHKHEIFKQTQSRGL